MTENLQYKVIKDEYAEVISVNHPLIKARGFTTIKPGEIIILEDNNLGQVLSFDKNEIKLMVFSKNPVKAGSKIYRTNSQLSFPVGANLLGSVFNPLGEVILSSNNENKTPATYKEIYQEPPKIIQRKRIEKQLITGFSITDLLLPMGQGQRELLIGDRKSGKANFARSLAVKQAKSGNKVVYAMIAKKVADIKHTYDFFTKQNVINSVTIIASTPKDPISSIVITPHAAMTVAEYLMAQGDNVLLILDDLTSQAEFYREISLLAKKFPGRDSYPGDIFFTQAQLLERAGSFINPKDQEGTVSITCLPVVRTSNSDLTDFIASNLISITDGHLLFDTRLFSQGIRPAIQFGLSVTRVGKQTQTQLQRDINLKITSFLSTYQKTKNLTHLGSEISNQSQKVLHQGKLLTDFFSESNGITINVQIIIIAMIWLEWFENSHKKVIDSCKFELTRNNEKENIRLKIEEIISKTNSFKELLEVVNKNKVFLLNLCQT